MWLELKPIIVRSIRCNFMERVDLGCMVKCCANAEFTLSTARIHWMIRLSKDLLLDRRVDHNLQDDFATSGVCYINLE